MLIITNETDSELFKQKNKSNTLEKKNVCSKQQFLSELFGLYFKKTTLRLFGLFPNELLLLPPFIRN
ncbi:hypothetical protein C9423_13540 [Lactobacillus sp. Koumiss]|nr:hypothetical protein C9423_13540 [Lactobacillus sp. Koumiss]